MATVDLPSSSTQHSSHMAGPDCLFNTSTPTTIQCTDQYDWDCLDKLLSKVLQLKCDKSGWFQIYQMTQTTSPRPSSAMDGSGGGLNTSMAKMESLVARIIRYVSLCTMGGWPE